MTPRGKSGRVHTFIFLKYSRITHEKTKHKQYIGSARVVKANSIHNGNYKCHILTILSIKRQKYSTAGLLNL